jgi:hypothetical protein
VLLIEPNAPEAVLWARGEDRTWSRDRSEGLDAEVELPGIGISLALRDLYDGVEFPAGSQPMRE